MVDQWMMSWRQTLALIRKELQALFVGQRGQGVARELTHDGPELVAWVGVVGLRGQ